MTHPHEGKVNPFWFGFFKGFVWGNVLGLIAVEVFLWIGGRIK